MIIFILGMALLIGLLLWGSYRRDRKALEKIAELNRRNDSTKMLIASYQQEIRTLRKIDGRDSHGIAVLVEEDLKLYVHRRDESIDGSFELSFNKGVVHGLNAALLRIRGWV